MIHTMMQGSREFPLRQYRRRMTPAQSGERIGLLIVLTYLAAIVIALAIGKVAIGSNFDLIVSLAMVVAACAAYFGGNALNRAEAHCGRTRSSAPGLPRTSFFGRSSSRNPRRAGRVRRRVGSPLGWVCLRQKAMKKTRVHVTKWMG